MDGSLDLARADIGFSAAHFSVHQDRSERLHGHNYLVRVRARGGIDEEGTVVDFSALKAALHALCAGLDERMLVPTRSSRVRVEETADSVYIEEGSRRFVIPRGDVVLLPIVNTTCECLAVHLLGALREQLGATTYRLELLVEEAPGQAAGVVE